MTANSLCNVFMQKTFKRSIHKQQNHYEVLKLAQNCTHTDIKRAYYELSKKVYLENILVLECFTPNSFSVPPR